MYLGRTSCIILERGLSAAVNESGLGSGRWLRVWGMRAINGVWEGYVLGLEKGSSVVWCCCTFWCMLFILGARVDLGTCKMVSRPWESSVSVTRYTPTCKGFRQWLSWQCRLQKCKLLVKVPQFRACHLLAVSSDCNQSNRCYREIAIIKQRKPERIHKSNRK